MRNLMEERRVVGIETRLAPADAVPLVVDLDGTLIRTDLLLETTVALLKRSLRWALFLPLWLLRGRAALKAEIARRVVLDVSTLPFNEQLLAYLRREKARGRRLVLATGADERLACKVADALGLFDEVLASDGARNLSGRKKLEALHARFGNPGFDYAGNGAADYPIWAAARRAIVVGAAPGALSWADRNAAVERVFPRQPRGLGVYVRALRVHQWVKNLLLFVPLVTALKFTDAEALVRLAVACVSFSLCASSVYVLNDMADVADDRRHPYKRKRPFAAGELPLAHGFVLIPVLLAAAGLLAWFLPWRFGAVIAAYYATTLAYTFVLKRIEGMDVLALALLYTTRVLAGGMAAGIALSFWLLTFSVFMFLSLALAKRYAELTMLSRWNNASGTNCGERSESGAQRRTRPMDGPRNNHKKAAGRGYRVADMPVVYSMGVSAGYVAALVLGLYLNSPQVARAYDDPVYLWALVPILIYWVTRVWLKTYRGEMHDDPVVFALRDRASLAMAALCAAVIALAV